MNTEQVLTRLHIDFESRTKAVQQVRLLIEDAPDPLAAAKALFLQLVPPNTEFNFTDSNDARVAVAYLVQDAILLGEQYDPERALEKAARYIVDAKATRPWDFIRDKESAEQATATVTEDRAGVQVQIKADGKIKKGGKQILAAALYEQHKGKPSKEIIAIFMKELDMGLGGARTYFYNCVKAPTK